jgi:hypothetical protein
MEKDQYTGSEKYRPLNELAAAYWEEKQKSTESSEYNNILHKLFDEFNKVMLSYVQHKYKDISEVHTKDIVFDLFCEQLGYNQSGKKGWNPEMGPFGQTSAHLLVLRCNTFLNKQSTENDRRVQTFYDEDSTDAEKAEAEANLYGESKPDERPDSQTQMHDLTFHVFQVLNDAVQVAISKSPNKFCYAMRFYTEMIAKLIYDNTIELRDLPELTETRMDIAFADSFLEQKIASLPDIKGAALKSLQCFTGKETDAQKSCGYDLFTVVYQQYVEAVKEKKPNDSAISQQRTKFRELLREAGMQLGL